MKWAHFEMDICRKMRDKTPALRRPLEHSLLSFFRKNNTQRIEGKKYENGSGLISKSASLAQEGMNLWKFEMKKKKIRKIKTNSTDRFFFSLSIFLFFFHHKSDAQCSFSLFEKLFAWTKRIFFWHVFFFSFNAHTNWMKTWNMGIFNTFRLRKRSILVCVCIIKEQVEAKFQLRLNNAYAEHKGLFSVSRREYSHMIEWAHRQRIFIRGSDFSSSCLFFFAVTNRQREKRKKKLEKRTEK